ncbi:hypothetical protein [Limosilactobacillus mucosae]|uniref:hypothetical protein n=1 Tax=Limosilactobacillus mucosae TaxID=97478 RepID=UPI001F581829|nr:hypothetical protein [Limosilactobacillus mucosae]UNL61548.1 hypothetical protein G8B17_04185 [Limosilactobacillus mucosae]
MKIYEVIPNFLGGSSHVMIAKNKSDAIEMTVNYLNQFQTHDLYKTSDFCASAIDADKFSEPTIIV